MAAGQALGTGSAYWLGAPAMLLFLPYPWLNYHAVNITPYLLVRDELSAERPQAWRRLLVLPALVAVYLACGATINLVGAATGLNR